MTPYQRIDIMHLNNYGNPIFNPNDFGDILNSVESKISRQLVEIAKPKDESEFFRYEFSWKVSAAFQGYDYWFDNSDADELHCGMVS